MFDAVDGRWSRCNAVIQRPTKNFLIKLRRHCIDDTTNRTAVAVAAAVGTTNDNIDKRQLIKHQDVGGLSTGMHVQTTNIYMPPS